MLLLSFFSFYLFDRGLCFLFFFFSSRRRHTRCYRDWSSDVCSSDLPHDALYYYWGRELHAVRSGRWKLHLPHPYQHLEQVGGDGKPGRYVRQEQELARFDLAKDVGETTNVA